MNAKKAKALRHAARQVAASTGIPSETQYLIHRRGGVVRLGRCLKGLVRHMKKKVRRGEFVFGQRRAAPAIRPIPESGVPEHIRNPQAAA